MLEGYRMAKTMPEGYVESQRDYNSLHNNGAKEVHTEEAVLYIKEFSKWIKMHDTRLDLSILDAGCRLGYGLRTFIEEFPAARVVGVDIVPEFVAEADAYSEAYEMDMHNLNFKDKEFDFTFCCQALEHCYDISKAVDELYRVTKTAAFISVPLEIAGTYELNRSHYAYTDSSFDWVAALNRPDWQLIKAELGPNSYFNMLVCRGVE